MKQNNCLKQLFLNLNDISLFIIVENLDNKNYLYFSKN